MGSNLNFIDFCSGVGAGRLGLELAGFECLRHSEIDIKSDKTYNLLFNDLKNVGDLTKIVPNSLPDCSLFVAGFPCQTFSIVGKRAGFNDNRGQIIYYLSNLLKEKNVPYFIFENVKGLLNHNKGFTIKKIVELLENCGYVVSYKLLNSIDFGVPQLRERIYFVGIRKDLYYKNFEFPNISKISNIKDFLINKNNEILNVDNSTFKKYLNNKYNAGKFDIEKILQKDYLILDTRQSDLRIYENKCPTLRTGRHGLLYVKNGNLYKLSGIEAMLLQGFPQKLVFKIEKIIPNSLLLSQAGNAMTVPVIQEIGIQLSKYIGGNIYEFSGKRFSNCQERVQERA